MRKRKLVHDEWTKVRRTSSDESMSAGQENAQLLEVVPLKICEKPDDADRSDPESHFKVPLLDQSKVVHRVRKSSKEQPQRTGSCDLPSTENSSDVNLNDNEKCDSMIGLDAGTPGVKNGDISAC